MRQSAPELIPRQRTGEWCWAVSLLLFRSWQDCYFWHAAKGDTLYSFFFSSSQRSGIQNYCSYRIRFFSQLVQ
jgi:hypothetical protein